MWRFRWTRERHGPYQHCRGLKLLRIDSDIQQKTDIFGIYYKKISLYIYHYHVYLLAGDSGLIIGSDASTDFEVPLPISPLSMSAGGSEQLISLANKEILHWSLTSSRHYSFRNVQFLHPARLDIRSGHSK